MSQERFLTEAEGQKLFGLSITDPDDGYIKLAGRMFPGLGSYSLEQQTGVIDLLYNYGSGNLRKYGCTVISAIKAGDWTKAGDEVLKLPSHKTTFAKANPARSQAIKKSLQTPTEDPCK
jgi:hypothetical protein